MLIAPICRRLNVRELSLHLTEERRQKTNGGLQELYEVQTSKGFRLLLTKWK